MKKPKLVHALNGIKKKKELSASSSLEIIRKKIAQKPAHMHIPSGKRCILPFSNSSSILVLGDGNFSYSASLCKIIGHASNIISTCYDSEAILKEKYPDCEEHIQTIESLAGTVLFGIDATCLEKCKELKGRRFNRIIFNFPHTGAGIKDEERNIAHNQEMLKKFFACSARFLSNGESFFKSFSINDDRALPLINMEAVEDDEERGEIHVTLKMGNPYEKWNIKALAKEASLKCKESFDFIPERYPGYCHRRTIGFDEDISGNDLLNKHCKTFVFVKEEVITNPKK